MGAPHIVVVGGGAAGFFAAIAAKERAPAARVTILERSNKILSKVRVSGGGRCNVTHACFQERKLAAHYPRGERFLRKVFPAWSVKDTIDWFERRGVLLKTEADGRMFPSSDDSRSITGLLEGQADQCGVIVRRGVGLRSMMQAPPGYDLVLDDGGTEHADRVILCTGGAPKKESLGWLAALGQPVVAPVPSLFTFNLKVPLRHLMGIVAPSAVVWIEGLDRRASGPVLITHWGFSGPAILKLSAWCARELHGMAYHYTVRVCWVGLKEEELRALLEREWQRTPNRLVANAVPADLPSRLWEFLLDRAGIAPGRTCASVGRHDRNRLIDVLVNDRHEAEGKTTFKEEFVTAGGVDLAQVDARTMESLVLPGLHFAGEVLDIDGLTGGFNFQAAWSTGRIAGLSAAAAVARP